MKEVKAKADLDAKEHARNASRLEKQVRIVVHVHLHALTLSRLKTLNKRQRQHKTRSMNLAKKCVTMWSRYSL